MYHTPPTKYAEQRMPELTGMDPSHQGGTPVDERHMMQGSRRGACRFKGMAGRYLNSKSRLPDKEEYRGFKGRINLISNISQKCLLLP